jgi:hypothetical protein
VHDEAVTDARPDQRTGKPAVVGPHLGGLAGQQLDGARASFELDLDHARIGVRVDRLRQRQIVAPPGGLLGGRRLEDGIVVAATAQAADDG